MALRKNPDFVQQEERPSRRYGLDEHGIEFPDPRPVEIPTRLRMPQRQVDRVREIIRQELSQQASKMERETFEEADDFSLPDVEPFSPYEEVFEPLPKGSDGDKLSPRAAKGTDAKGDIDGKGSDVKSGGSGDSSGGAGDAGEVVRPPDQSGRPAPAGRGAVSQGSGGSGAPVA